jgi:hypothetical protein
MKGNFILKLLERWLIVLLKVFTQFTNGRMGHGFQVQQTRHKEDHISQLILNPESEKELKGLNIKLCPINGHLQTREE